MFLLFLNAGDIEIKKKEEKFLLLLCYILLECRKLPFPSPGNLPNPGIEPGSPTLWAVCLPPEPPGKTMLYSSR